MRRRTSSKTAAYRIEAVGFDFGGTIVPIIRNLFNQIFIEALCCEVDIKQAHKIFSSFIEQEQIYWHQQKERQTTNLALDLLIEAAETVGANLPITQFRRVVAIVAERLATEIRPRRQVHFIIRRLISTGFRVGLLSNWLFPTDVLQRWLTVHDLDSYFSCVLGSSDLGIRKPKAEAFCSLAKSLKLSTVGSLAYVGDNFEEDVIGAVHAGCGVVIWLSKHKKVSSDRAYVNAQALTQIPQILDQNDSILSDI